MKSDKHEAAKPSNPDQSRTDFLMIKTKTQENSKKKTVLL